MSGSRILLLGVDKYLLRACARHGVRPVVAQSAVAFDEGLTEVPPGVPRVRVDDVTDPASVLAALHRADLVGEPFDAVLTSIEVAVVNAALLSVHFGCAGLDPVVALHCRDKALQKTRVRDAGIDTARFEIIEDICDTADYAQLPFERAVLKPIAGAATANTVLIDDIGVLHEQFAHLRAERPQERAFLLEEFVPGEEWVVDGVIHEGEVLFFALGVYSSPPLDVVANNLALEMRRFDPEREEWAYRLAEPVVRTAVSALGLSSGVFHMELFHHNGTLVFCECAARRGGALTHEEVQAKFNVDLGECAVLCALGRRPDLVVKVRSDAIGGTNLLGVPGTLIDCPTPANLQALPGVEFARVQQPFGTQIAPGMRSTGQRLGQVLVAADTEQALVARMAEVRQWFADRLLVVPSDSTKRERRAWQRRNWPEADFGEVLWG